MLKRRIELFFVGVCCWWCLYCCCCRRRYHNILTPVGAFSSLGLIEHCRLSGIHIYELKMAWALWANNKSSCCSRLRCWCCCCCCHFLHCKCACALVRCAGIFCIRVLRRVKWSILSLRQQLSGCCCCCWCAFACVFAIYLKVLMLFSFEQSTACRLVYKALPKIMARNDYKLILKMESGCTAYPSGEWHTVFRLWHRDFHHMFLCILKCCCFSALNGKGIVAASRNLLIHVCTLNCIFGEKSHSRRRQAYFHSLSPRHTHRERETAIKGDVYLLKAHLNPLSFTATPIYAVFSICSIPTKSHRFLHSLRTFPCMTSLHFVSHTKHVYSRRRVRLFNEIIFQYVCNRCERTFIANRRKCKAADVFVSVVLLLFKALSIPEITSNMNNNSNDSHTCTPVLPFPAV